MSEPYVRILILVVVIGLLAVVARLIKKGKVQTKSDKGSFKVKDSMKLSFQSEIICVEHDGQEILLLSSQGEYRQVFKSTPSFKNMVGG